MSPKVSGSCLIVAHLNSVERWAVLAIAICCLYGPALFLGGCGAGKDKVSAPNEQSKGIAPAAVQVSGNNQTHVEMVNVNLHLDSSLILHIHYLSGQFVSTRKGQPPAFDDKLSYVVAIDSAEVGVRSEEHTSELQSPMYL